MPTSDDRLRGQDGATAVEYALFLAAIAAVIIGTVIVLGGQVLGMFQTVDGAF